MNRGWSVFASAWLLLTLLSSAWAMTTPISGAPDEPAHIVKAASVARGELVGVPSEHGHTVTVPQYIATSHDMTCFAFQPAVSADCADSVPEGDSTLVQAETSAGLYNPIYYALVGWPSLLVGNESGIYLMRIVSGMVASTFLALCFVLVASWARKVLAVLGLVIACTPMVLFLNGVVNPNSLETAAILAAFVALLSIVFQPSERLLTQRLVILGISSAFAVNARGLSPLWLAIVLVIPLFLLKWSHLWSLLRRKSTVVTIGAIIVSVLLALLWTLSSNSLAAGVSSDVPVTNYPGVGSSHLTGFITIFRETFGYANGLIGQFGWLDNTAPAVTLYLWAALTGFLFVSAVGVLRGRSLLTFILLGAAVVIVPAVIQGLYVTKGGFIWQGRYTLPLFVCLVVGTSALMSDRITWGDRSTRLRITGAVLGAALFAQMIAFAVVLQRYAVGTSSNLHDFYLSPSWQPPGGVITWLAIYTIVLLTGAIAIYQWLSRESDARALHQEAHVDGQPDHGPDRKSQDAPRIEIDRQEEQHDNSSSRRQPTS